MALFLTLLMIIIPLCGFLTKYFVEVNRVYLAAASFIATIALYFYLVYTIFDLLVKAST